MLKPFLVAFNNAEMSRQSLLDYLDTRPEIKNWYAFLPSSILVVSDHTARQVAEIIRSGFPGKYYVVTEVPPGANDGWLAKEVWDFINNPRSSGRWTT